MGNNQIAWTAENGSAVVITATVGDFAVDVNGKLVFSGLFGEVPAAMAKRAAAAGIVATLGPIGLTTERRDALRAMRKALRAAMAADPLTTLATLECALEAAHEAVLAYRSNPAPAYATQAQAQAAHPEAWATESARRDAAKVARKAERAESFVARGLD